MATEKIENPARKGEWCVEMRRTPGTYVHEGGKTTYEWVDSWHCVRVAAAYRDGTVKHLDAPGVPAWTPYVVKTLSPQYQRAAESLVGQTFPDAESLKAALQAAVNA